MSGQNQSTDSYADFNTSLHFDCEEIIIFTKNNRRRKAKKEKSYQQHLLVNLTFFKNE